MKKTEPFCRDTALTGYFPLPREILEFPLSGTAVLLYAVLLDRGTLSQKSGYANQAGQVYVIYTIEHLAETLHKGITAVKRCLNELEAAGLIRRERPGMTCPSRIFLFLPMASFRTVTQPESSPCHSPKTDPVTARNASTTNLSNQQDTINYFYQLREDESL